MHDGVLWEWEQYYSGGKGGMDGPFCPRDVVRLQYQTPIQPTAFSPRGLGLGQQEQRPTFSPPERLYTAQGREPTDQDRVGGFDVFGGVEGGRLFCIKCRNDYALAGDFLQAAMGKTVGEARHDAALLFEAKRKERERSS